MISALLLLLLLGLVFWSKFWDLLVSRNPREFEIQTNFHFHYYYYYLIGWKSQWLHFYNEIYIIKSLNIEKYQQYNISQRTFDILVLFLSPKQQAPGPTVLRGYFSKRLNKKQEIKLKSRHGDYYFEVVFDVK